MSTITTTLFVFVIFMSLCMWLLIKKRQQVIKDWNTLKELKNKANKVSSKEEIEEFHKEFVEKARKISNDQIKPKLMQIDGYLRGLYKQFKT